MATRKQTSSKEVSKEATIAPITEGRKVRGVILKHTDAGVFVDCDGGLFTGVILAKEVRDLKRNGVDLLPGTEVEAEVINPKIRHDEGYYIISVTKLLQVDIWKSLMKKAETREIFTVVPTEANLGGLLVDMHGIKGFIPLSQLAPIHYPRVEDGDQEVIFQKLLDLIGIPFSVRIISVDEEEKRVVLSEREALKEETERILSTIKVGDVYDGIVSGISSYGLFVTLGGSVEGLVHISEITYGHVSDIDKVGLVGQPIKVKVIGYENGKISLSCKKLKEDPWIAIARDFKVGDIIEGEVVRFVPYGIFVRIYDDINGLVHLSELSTKGIANPHEIVRVGEVVRAKIILLDTKNRRIGLSMKALYETEESKQEEKDKKTNIKAKSSPRQTQRRVYVKKEGNTEQKQDAEKKEE